MLLGKQWTVDLLGQSLRSSHLPSSSTAARRHFSADAPTLIPRYSADPRAPARVVSCRAFNDSALFGSSEPSDHGTYRLHSLLLKEPSCLLSCRRLATALGPLLPPYCCFISQTFHFQLVGFGDGRRVQASTCPCKPAGQFCRQLDGIGGVITSETLDRCGGGQYFLALRSLALCSFPTVGRKSWPRPLRAPLCEGRGPLRRQQRRKLALLPSNFFHRRQRQAGSVLRLPLRHVQQTEVEVCQPLPSLSHEEASLMSRWYLALLT